jgi:hypothetical protein
MDVAYRPRGGVQCVTASLTREPRPSPTPGQGSRETPIRCHVERSRRWGPPPVHLLPAVSFCKGQGHRLPLRGLSSLLLRCRCSASFASRPVDVIVAHYAIGTATAMAATRTIPIVMVHGAPLQLGAINSLAQPGGNVTEVYQQWTLRSEENRNSFQTSAVLQFSPPPRPRAHLARRS